LGNLRHARSAGIFASPGGVPKLPVMHQLQAEGHAVQPGMMGENILIEGLDWARDVLPGAQLALDPFRLWRNRKSDPSKSDKKGLFRGESLSLRFLVDPNGSTKNGKALGEHLRAEITSYAALCKQIAVAVTPGQFRRVQAVPESMPGC
jgi:hypothetical protein